MDRLLALREDHFDFERQEVWIGTSYLVRNGQRIEKDTKTGEGRCMCLDALTCELLADHFARRRAAAAEVGVRVPPDAFAFSPDPDGSQPWNPDTMTHRYERYATTVGISSSLKELRHYSVTSAAELTAIAETLAPMVGLDLQTALGYATEFNGDNAS